MTETTPGPWRRTGSTIHTQATAELPALMIARVFDEMDTDAVASRAQADANGDLLAAAPALAERLEKITAMMRNYAPRTWSEEIEANEDALRAAGRIT